MLTAPACVSERGRGRKLNGIRGPKMADTAKERPTRVQYTSYLDSGSNAVFFLDQGTTGISLCPGDMNIFYCPTVTTNLNAAVTGVGTSANVRFSVANAGQLAARNFAFNNLAGPMGGYPDPQQPSFDWGLPFFFGRSVFTAIEDKPTPAGSGPYFAF